MKVIHLSDIHIGVENYGKPTPLADLENLPKYFAPGVDRENYLGISTRLLDFLETFDAVIHYIKENDVDLVLFAGDAYKSRDPNQTHQQTPSRCQTLWSKGIHLAGQMGYEGNMNLLLLRLRTMTVMATMSTIMIAICTCKNWPAAAGCLL